MTPTTRLTLLRLRTRILCAFGLHEEKPGSTPFCARCTKLITKWRP